MISGISEQASSHGGFWGSGNEGDFLNAAGEPRKWTLHGDYRAWCADNDVRAPVFQKHIKPLDHLVDLLKAGDAAPETARRLRDVDFHEFVMAVCYPGETRSRYLRHCDVSRGATLSTIFYLSSDWRTEDEGCLRLFWPGEVGSRVKDDILPIAGRMLMFWASEEVPHEVLSTKRDRFTLVVWYKTGRDALNTGANWLADLLLRHQSVSPLTMGEAMRRAGSSEETICLVEGLQARLARYPDEATKIDVLRAALLPLPDAGLPPGEEEEEGECVQCSRSGMGQWGRGPSAGAFYCGACWEAWLLAARDGHDGP
eukprot:NODE_2476_length_2205_cov_3.719923.p1 GENE.NODE_2476_length_2205_cov_3.719923~~NODE_2476_length_2205_cov_3.719923.p1  ORF type:complete len:313 (-),score=103.42 NODE_2476_length_2205_cov_3.719923:391-1329(-)